MAASAYTDTVQKVYIAYYGRAADPVGLAYWSAAIDTAGGSLAAIMASFGASAEATTLYGSLSNTAKVNAIYQQSFGRDADFAGLMYYAGQLSAGTMTAASIAQNIFDGASGTDATMLTNKLVVAKAYTAAIDTASEVVAYSGTVAATAARTLLSTVDATTVTAGFDVATSVAGIVTTANATPAADAVAAKTFALTTGADGMTGTSVNDTFNGSLIFDSSEVATTAATFTIADTLNGGGGTGDTINLVVSGAQNISVVVPAASISNIETLNVRNTIAQTASVDASSITGLTLLTADRGIGAVTVTNLASGAEASMIGNGTIANGAFSVGYVAAATAATLNVTNGTTAGANVITGTGILSQVVNSTGAANTTGALTGAASATSTTINATTALTTAAATNLGATVTITGAGAVSTGSTALESGVTSLNASANTGGLTVALGSAVTQAITGSAGDDVITSGAVLTTGSVNAGAGDDTLVIGTNVSHANTAALAAKYTNFETLSVGNSFDMSLYPDVTGVTAVAMTSKSLTGLTATHAANVTVAGDQSTAFTVALAAATGTSDVLTMTMGTGLTTGASFDVAGLVMTGFETANLVSNPGPTATVGANQTVTLSVLTGATLANLNLTGNGFAITSADTTVAVAIDASALTGDNTAAGSKGLAIAGTTFATGSVVTGSALIDSVILDAGTEGVTLNLGAGADAITANVATLVADGTNDVTFNGGAGTDTVTVTNATITMTDNHFTSISNMEKLVLTSTTGDLALSVGTAFNVAYPDGVTITTGEFAAAKEAVINAGLATVPVSVTLTMTDAVLTALEANVITTGSGADTITWTGDGNTVGVTGSTAGTIVISSGAGVDTISVVAGTLLPSTGGQFLTVTGGTGADIISATKINSTTVTAAAIYVVAEGDSLTTAYDQISSFDLGTANLMSDGIDFASTSTVGTLGTSIDSGTILTHSVTAAVATFDDASTFATAIVINSSNLSDAVGYLNANTSNKEVLAFLYDSDNNGANDATMVYHNGVATDSLVMLVGITAVDALIATTNVAGANDLFIT